MEKKCKKNKSQWELEKSKVKRKKEENKHRGNPFKRFRGKFPHIRTSVVRKIFNENYSNSRNSREQTMSLLVKHDFDNNFKEIYEKFQRKENKKCIFIEKKGDLFTSFDSLGHCISEDIKMGKGIAVLFVKKFKCKKEIVEQKKKVGEVAVIFDEENERVIFNIITKKRYFMIPSYENLYKALKETCKLCKKYNISRLSLPKIACGLDRLEWNIVKDIIIESFYDTKITITIFHYDK